MAYSFTVSKPVQSNVGGALVLIYEVVETDVSPGDEFTIECLPEVGIVSLYGAEITDDAGGTVTTLQPSLGVSPGFVPDTLDHIWTLCGPTVKPVREANVASYASTAGRIVGRSGVTAPGGSVTHRFAITESHGHIVGLGDGYSRTNPVPVEQLAKAVFFGDIFINALGSSQLAIDARFTGTPIEVHNGTDNIYWTGSNIVGGNVTFNDGTRAFDGVLSVLVANMGVGDIFEFDSGITVDISGYTALEFKIWVVGNWTIGDIVQVYAVDGTGEIGSRIDLGDTIERSQTGMWQSAVIPVSSFGVTLITGLRVEQGPRVGQGPTFSADAIKFHESGGPVVYFAVAPPGFRARIQCLIVTITAPYVTVATNNGSSGVSPFGFLNIPTLDIGILAGQLTDGAFVVTALWRDLRDTGKFGYFMQDPVLTDGTTTTIYIVREFTTPIVVEGSPALNNLQFLLQDNFEDWDDGEVIWTGNLELI
jgi:hypothetical protein